MDLQSGLVLGGVAVAACAVLVLVSLFRSTGTSYEEAVAEQRRATSELLALAGSNNKQMLKKNKKAGKKAKEKKQKEIATGSERESDAPADSGQEEEPAAAAVTPQRPHVEFGENTIVDVPLDKPVKPQIRKRGKEAKIKPILLNREEGGSDPSSPPTPAVLSNHFEELHPKDEFELFQAHLAADRVEKKEEVIEKKEAKPNKAGKGKQGKQPQQPAAAAAEPVAVEEPAHKEVQHSGDFAKEQRKNKKNEKRQQVDDSGDKPAAARDEGSPPPLNPVQPAELTTDKLLRHLAQPPAPAPAPTPAPPKTKKAKRSDPAHITLGANDVSGVNVSELVRLLNEVALSRSEIQILTDALLNKQNEAPLSEWSEGPNDPVQKLKKQLAEKEKALADEQEASQAIHNKLKELRASLNTERARASAAASHSKVEVHTLTARMQRLMEENHTLEQDKLALHSKLQADNEAAAQRVQLEMHIQRLTETENALAAQLGALQAEVGARVLEAGQARCEAAAARDATHKMQQHVAELTMQLKEASRAHAELEATRAKLARLETEVREAGEEVSRLRRVERECGHLQCLVEEANEYGIQMKNEVASLHEQLASSEEQMIELHASHQQNGLPSPADTLKQEQEVSKLEGAVLALQAELETALASHGQDKQTLAQLRAELQQYRDKNNELRTKNWKVMEALQSAERSLQSQATHNSNNEALAKALEKQSLETAEVLRAACPQAAPAGPADSKWLATFAQQLSTVLRAASTERSSLDLEGKLDELRGQNAHLHELVDKYKKIIEETEGVLSSLQQNVVTEEERWARQLRDKQRELERLQQHTVTQMQSKIDSLQAELERRPAPASHSLADVERGLEETNRLLSISDKHQIDSLNGPSQLTNNPTTDSKMRRPFAGWLRRKITFKKSWSKHGGGETSRPRRTTKPSFTLCPANIL